jgi:hypothetical protein
MSPVLFSGHPAIPYFQHIRVVPFSRSGIPGKILLLPENADHAVPADADIACVPPEVTHIPGPWSKTSLKLQNVIHTTLTIFNGQV